MAAIERKPIGQAGLGARIFEPGGRTVVRINDDVMSPLGRKMGWIPVCDFSGNLMAVPADLEVVCVEMDRLDPVFDGDGQDVLIRGWQGSLN